MPMIKIGHRIGKPQKKCDARKIAVRREVSAAVEDQPGSRAVGRRDEDRHGRGVRGVCPAKSRNFGRVRPFSCEGMRIRKRGEVVAVESGAVLPADKLNPFVGVKMMLAEVLAYQKLRQVLHGASAELWSGRRNRSDIKK